MANMAPESMENLQHVTYPKLNVRKDVTRESKKWDAFLVDLYAKLSEYNIQKDKEKYNVDDIEDWGELGEKEGIMITENTFNSFLNKVAQYNVIEYENIKKIAITKSQLAELNHILSLTLKHGVHKSCLMPNELVIKGDYIKISDFIKNDGNITLTSGCKNVTAVNVFALNTIFVDRDIILPGKEININIISPKWDIISTRMIDLSGVGSKKLNSTLIRTEEVPEKRGGNFFGIGAEFVNGKNLSIITNGNGKGNITSNIDRCTADWFFDGRRKETRLPIYRSCIEFSLHVVKFLLREMEDNDCQLSDHGTRTELDNPGKIVLFELNDNSGISKYDYTDRGDIDRLIMLIRNGKMLNMAETHRQVTRVTDERDIQDLVKVKIINKYKHYLRDNLNDRFKESHLIEFLRHLDTNDNVKSVYNTLELFDEFKDLEEQFYNFKNDVDFLPVYRLLLYRIREYVLTVHSIQLTKILIYLYMAILGKISYLKELPKRAPILDIDQDLETVINDIGTLRMLRDATRKADLLNENKENYKRNIDEQIVEATNVIKQQITPEINNIINRIDVQIERLISEIKALEALEKLTEEGKSELIEKRKQLKSAMELRVFSGALKIVGLVLSFFGSIELAAGVLIELSSRKLELSFVYDELGVQKSLKSDIESYVDQIKIANNEPNNHLNELLEDISLMINVHSDQFNDTAVKIVDMKNRLCKVDGDKFRQVQMIEIELKQELKRKGEDLTSSTKKVNTDGKAAKAIAVMEKINKLVAVYEMGFDIYSKFKSDEANVNVITAAIAQKYREIEQPQKYEKTIHDITMPMLKNMEDILRGIANELDTESEVAFDVSKWQVQSVLKDIMLKMQKLTRMFPDIHDDLSHCIEMMEVTITTLINIYDQIQDYQTEQKFINSYEDTIEDITGSDVIIRDPRFSNIVNEDYLEKLMRSNQVIMKYKKGIEAFKNFVFPLAHEYLGDTVLPSHLQLERNFENLLSTAATQMEYLKSKVKIYRTYNPYIKFGPFTSDYTSTEPFFRLKNEQNNDLISKLLSGQKVTIRADISHSPEYNDAIKFSVGEFFFKAQNETMQDEINDALHGFRFEAEHLGDSQYRCNGKIYLIRSRGAPLSYSLGKTADGEPLSRDLYYIWVKIGDLALSPYATWELQMLTDGISEHYFRYLQEYKDAVDLELRGYGSFIDNRQFNYENLTMENYYEEIGTDNQQNLHTEPETSRRRNVRSVDLNDHDASSSALLDFLSPINNVGNFLRKKISAFNYPRPIETITSWFRNDESEVDEETSEDLGFTQHDHDLLEFDLQKTAVLPDFKVEQLSNNSFIDGQNNSTKTVNYDLLDKQGNLLLLDLLLRKKNYTKYQNEDNAVKDYLDNEYAQNLAYSAYASEDKSSNNSTHV